MKWIMFNPVAVMRGLLILLFVYSAVPKLINSSSFANDLLKASYLNIDLLPILLWIIPLSECIAVFLLLFKRTLLPGLAASLLLMTLFTWHLLLIWNVNPLSPCSCGALFSSLSPLAHIALNVIIISLIMVSIYFHSSSKIVAET